uniref:RTE1-like protein 1 n=1 Tax=Dianthus caryophyllus TaxID=3570 RepID=E9NM92_DIACA|nr:RTE1-like protein 1 [Dianthus caryophyllus]
METNVDIEEQSVISDRPVETTMHIDPERGRFPFLFVWAPLPVLTWLIPFIGHIGICREDGVILCFTTSYFVFVDDFGYFSVTRYLQIDEKLCRAISSLPSDKNEERHQNSEENKIVSWDHGLQKSILEYQHHSYNLLTCNCHSFVANSLNHLGFCGGSWNVVSVAVLILLKGRWVDRVSMVKSYLPFAILFLICVFTVFYVSWDFLQFWVIFVVELVGWFLFGSYCCKGLVRY